jgi:hypothetical protein
MKLEIQSSGESSETSSLLAKGRSSELIKSEELVKAD